MSAAYIATVKHRPEPVDQPDAATARAEAAMRELLDERLRFDGLAEAFRQMRDENTTLRIERGCLVRQLAIESRRAPGVAPEWKPVAIFFAFGFVLLLGAVILRAAIEH